MRTVLSHQTAVSTLSLQQWLCSGRSCLLLVENRERRRLNATRVRQYEIYCECLAVFGDCPANLAYRLASSFQCEFDGVGIDLHPRKTVEIRVAHRRII